jgi:molybdopterin converting factor small subunit
VARGTIRYWAAAKAAAGVAEEPFDGTTLAEVLVAVRTTHPGELGVLLGRCSFLVDGVRSAPEQVLSDGAVIEVLPPFAGG